MTVIAAYQNKYGIWIGSDSAAVGGSSIIDRGSKIISRGDYHIGYTSNYRQVDMLVESRDLPAKLNGLRGVRTIRDFLLKEIKKHNKDLQDYQKADTALMIIGPKGIYTIDYDFHIAKQKQYLAIGFGTEVALGALYAHQKFKTKDGAQAVRDAVSAAITHTTCCGGRVFVRAIMN